MTFKFLSRCLLAVACLQASFAWSADGDTLDILIVGGTVIDGSGSDRYAADVGIVGDSIVAVGTDLAARYEAKRTIDAAGRIVAPGYIDVHTHAARVAYRDDREKKAALNLLHQGITTVNLGADGRHARLWTRRRGGDIEKLYNYLDSHPFGMNTFLLAGHDTFRKLVMGKDDFKRFSTPEEMEEMAGKVREYMNEGALGLSLGLEYASGRWSDVEELVHLARALAEYDKRGVIIAHERATGPQHRYYLPSRHNKWGLYGDRYRKYPDGWDVIDYVNEGIRIAEESGIVYDFTHFKITHNSYWGKSEEVIGLINDARDRGVKLYAEHIAFTNSGNRPMNLPLIPTKYYDDTEYSYAELEQVLAKRSKAKDLRADIAWQIDKHGGAYSAQIIFCRTHPEWVGMTIAQMMTVLGIDDPVEAVLKIKEMGDADLPNGARYRSRQTLSARDVDNFVQQDWFGTVTDAGIYGLEGGFAQPRVFASFTNKITEFVQERKTITLEHAIRAGTHLPATMLSIPDRGLIMDGYKADIQVFDPDELAVNARWTLTDSRAYSDGVYYVLVNGTVALDNAEPTFELAGVPIRNQDVWTD